MPPPDDRPPDPQAAWQKAATIGAPGIGSRYLTPLNPTTWDLIKAFLGGERPQTVAAQDPYGIKAWEAGKGPPPMLFGTTEPVEAPGIRAYHGSPHEFEKFSLSKIGTGEGAQAYGHGLYFAEKEATAKAYREKLAEGTVELYGQEHPVPPWRGDFDPHTRLVRRLADVRAGRASVPESDVIALARQQIEEGLANPYADRTALQRELELLDRAMAHPAGIKTKPGGKMYEVNIEAHLDDFLDWDKPLSEQPANVKTVANDLFRGRLVTREVGPDLVDVYEKGGGSLGVFPKDKAADVLANPADYYPYKGRELYEQVVEANRKRLTDLPSKYAGRRDPSAASAALRERGIPGIKYLDQGSRAAGEGSRNFVVFDDKLVSILRKYGLLPPIAAGTLGLSQLARPAQPEAR